MWWEAVDSALTQREKGRVLNRRKGREISGGGTRRQILARWLPPLTHRSPSHPLPLCPSAVHFFLVLFYNLWLLSNHREKHGSEGELCFSGSFSLWTKPWIRESTFIFQLRGFYSHLDNDCGAPFMLFLPFPQDAISGIVCVCVRVCMRWCVWPSCMMNTPEGFESSGNGSSWKGVTNSKGVGVRTCSANCAANVTAALFKVEVCKVDS